MNFIRFVATVSFYSVENCSLPKRRFRVESPPCVAGRATILNPRKGSESMDARFLFQYGGCLLTILFGVPSMGAQLEVAHYVASPPQRQEVRSGVQYVTTNFEILNAPTPELARLFGETAERCRSELAVLWLGNALPDWSARCPIRVQVGEKLGAGGATTFVFNDGEVYGWEMNIQGSARRIVDSVLPHEITHMILASHFRRPVPRWLDEGAATSVEHVAEKENYRRQLMQYLREDVRKGLPFNRMVALKEYPTDPMPFYSQGFSVVEYLIDLGGHQRLLEFAATGMESGNWNLAVKQHYRKENLGELQLAWVDWVAAGSKTVAVQPSVATPQRPYASVYAAGLDHLKPNRIPLREPLSPIIR